MQLKSALKQAQLNLDYTDIRAPIDGRIGRTAFTVGNLVNPGKRHIGDHRQPGPDAMCCFRWSVRDLETIREARRKEGGGLIKIDIRIRLSNGQDYPHPGVWNFTDPQVDQTTDSLIMRAVIPNPERNLVDGQFVTAIIHERKEEPRPGGPAVGAAGRPVRLLPRSSSPISTRSSCGACRPAPTSAPDIVVTSGVREGENVIVDGIQKVRPGQVVQEMVLPPKVGG